MNKSNLSAKIRKDLHAALRTMKLIEKKTIPCMIEEALSSYIKKYEQNNSVEILKT